MTMGSRLQPVKLQNGAAFDRRTHDCGYMDIELFITGEDSPPQKPYHIHSEVISDLRQIKGYSIQERHWFLPCLYDTAPQVQFASIIPSLFALIFSDSSPLARTCVYFLSIGIGFTSIYTSSYCCSLLFSSLLGLVPTSFVFAYPLVLAFQQDLITV